MKAADEVYMRAAICEAKRAEKRDDVPVGAVIVRDGRIIARGRNTRERKNDPAGHAEMNAIRRAGKKLGHWRLSGCTMYVTLEPCPMCAGAAVNARLDAVVYGADDKKAGALGGKTDLLAVGLNHRPEVRGGVLGRECAALLTEYFRKKRKGAKT